MALPINIDDLINSKTVEFSRIEFKAGWNPEAASHTICAFANDYQELGGGYLVIGVDEKDGVPCLPPVGLNQNQLDPIQKKFLEICNQINPTIFPVIEPAEVQGKLILVIWVTPGEERPYDAPATLRNNALRKTYVRIGSSTVGAKGIVLDRLRELAALKHFDERVNMQATVDEMDLDLITSYLREIKSDLADQAKSMTLAEIALKMQIARGPSENIRPLNVGLLCFSNSPEKFFEGAVTKLVEFEDSTGGMYADREFKGPIPTQIRGIMEYFRSNVIQQYTIKTARKVDADTFYNYPFDALEEAISNALYHRSYENPSLTEIRVFKRGTAAGGEDRRIEILSYPGALPPVDENALSTLNVTGRTYRNIRLGDFLKNLRLAEKYGTGIPTMVSALEGNGSPRPVLTMDEQRSFFSVVIYIHPETPLPDNEPATPVDRIQMTDSQQKIVEFLIDNPTGLNALVEMFGEKSDDDLKFLATNGLVVVSDFGAERVYHVSVKGLASLKISF